MSPILTPLIILFAAFFPMQDESLRTEIETLNRRMEEAFAAGDMKKVAEFYLDDAVLLSPNGEPVKGREAIDNYWTGITNPVDWELEVIAVTPDEQEIYENDYYKALETKPPSWRSAGFRPDSDEQALVYQLGTSTLTTKGPSGKLQESVVSFILVWKYTPEGYRILVDTYSW